MVAIGIDLGGTNIKAALTDREKGIIDKLSIPTEADRGKDHVFDRIRLAVDKLKASTGMTPDRMGIGSPGIVLPDRQTVKHPPNFKGWSTVNLAEELTHRTGLPCVVDNDANLAALGSSRRGVGQPYDSLIMLTLGTGVGGGIILNREIFRGGTGSAGELGHVIINFQGPASNSPARGGIEAYLGQRFLSRRAMERIRQAPENPLYRQFHEHPEALEPVDLYEAAERGDRLATDILESAGEKLGYAIVNYIHILDIRTIIVTGGIANAGHWIIDPAKRTALSTLMPPYREGFELLREPPEHDVALYGASYLAFESL